MVDPATIVFPVTADRLSIDIERTILAGELQPGDRLPSEQSLAQELGVSRVSIRQALHELEQRGLIDRKPGRGTIVRSRESSLTTHPLSAILAIAPGGASELTEIMELRALIEPPIAGLAAMRVTPRDIEQLLTLITEMERKPTLPDTRRSTAPSTRPSRSTRTTRSWPS